MVHYIIWGKYGSDNLESLICEKVNGDYIHTRKQAESVIDYWQGKIDRHDIHGIRDWRIQKVNLAVKPDFISAINV